MRELPVLLLALIYSFAQAAPNGQTYRLADYPAQVYRGGRHQVKITPEWRVMRTQIREGYRSGKIDFAGNYVTVLWGCGTQCLGGVLVDSRSGKIYNLIPLSTEYSLHACYRPDGSIEADIFHYQAGSRLFITENCHYAEITGREDKVAQFKTTYVYQWIEDEKRFVRLDKSVQRSSVPADVW